MINQKCIKLIDIPIDRALWGYYFALPIPLWCPLIPLWAHPLWSSL